MENSKRTLQTSKGTYPTKDGFISLLLFLDRYSSFPHLSYKRLGLEAVGWQFCGRRRRREGGRIGGERWRGEEEEGVFAIKLNFY